MEYRIEKKEGFTVIAAARMFPFEESPEAIPQFWTEHMSGDQAKFVCGNFGICIDDESPARDSFEYMIADIYRGQEVPDGLVLREIPAFTWAIFPCRGAMPEAIQGVTNRIYTEWLPTVFDFEIAAGICVEMYDDPRKYSKGNEDGNYYSEVWVPIRRKSA